MESCTHVLRHEMQNAQPVLMRLDLEMQNIDFDPLVPASVDAAIATVFRVTEALLGAFQNNPILGPLADDLRAQYLEGIHARVHEVRHLVCQH